MRTVIVHYDIEAQCHMLYRPSPRLRPTTPSRPRQVPLITSVVAKITKRERASAVMFSLVCPARRADRLHVLSVMCTHTA